MKIIDKCIYDWLKELQKCGAKWITRDWDGSVWAHWEEPAGRANGSWYSNSFFTNVYNGHKAKVKMGRTYMILSTPFLPCPEFLSCSKPTALDDLLRKLEDEQKQEA